MFWRKSPSVEIAHVEPTPPSQADEAFDDALDGAGGVLRALAKYSFPIDDESRESAALTYDRCAAHLLVLAPLDGKADASGRAPRRQWPAVVRSVTERRKREQEYVERTSKEAREAIQALVDGVGRACAEHGKANGQLRDHASRLKDAAATDSIADLKREATEFVGVVVNHLEAQRQMLADQTRDLRERLSRLQLELADARKEGGTDALTQLANRRTFDATIERQIQYMSILARPLSLILVDIDHFKAVNDRHGHPAGDHVLKEVANALVRAFPRRTDMVARYGGEEFVCLLPETTAADARVLADRMRLAIRTRGIVLGETKLTVTVSAGVAALTEGDGPAELIARADKALYAAKTSGRDRVSLASGPVSGLHRTLAQE